MLPKKNKRANAVLYKRSASTPKLVSAKFPTLINPSQVMICRLGAGKEAIELLRNTIFGLNLTWRELSSTRNSVNPRRPEYHPSFL